MRMVRTILLGISLLQAGVAWSGGLEGARQIYLVSGAGDRIRIGEVRFAPVADGADYTIAWNEAGFADYFLSMRPFRCIEGPDKLWCHVPYPYTIRRHVSADDLTDLEYDLLFLWKPAGAYGIDLWNGVYYRLTVQGDRIVGTINEMDMGMLAAPPADGSLRPVLHEDLYEADPESHWLPKVVIE